MKPSPAARLRTITELLLDIHGQHEHQSLLYESKHLEILDAYIRSQTQPLKDPGPPILGTMAGGSEKAF